MGVNSFLFQVLSFLENNFVMSCSDEKANGKWSYTPFISPNSQSLRTELHFQFIRFAAAILQCASVCFHTEHRISAFWKVRFKKRSKIEQKDIITPMHCLAFPSALFGAPFHIDNCTVADCGFWLEYASKTPLEVVADLPHRMRLFWLRCQIMRLRSVHIKPHYSQNAFDSALLAKYERGIRWADHSHSLAATFNVSIYQIVRADWCIEHG